MIKGHSSKAATTLQVAEKLPESGGQKRRERIENDILLIPAKNNMIVPVFRPEPGTPYTRYSQDCHTKY